MDDPDAMGNNDIFLYNNITEPPLFEDRTISWCNCALVVVMAPSILCYAWNKRFNIVERINAQFVFTNNILKKFIKSFHQMGTFILYKSLHCDFQANAKTVMEVILEKTRTRQFFISYDNMNFYENVFEQKIFNHSAPISYITRYICFMKPLNGIKNVNNSWEDQYIDWN